MPDPVALILLAAGGSTRMGSPKQLIDIDGMPLVTRVAGQLIALGAGPVGVVIGGSADAVRQALAGLDVAILENANWSAGLGTSIRAGVAWARSNGAAAALIALCDQPEIDAGHLKKLIAQRPGAAIVATAYAGSRGVPAVFDASAYDRLLALPDDRGAKGVISDPSLRVREVACEAARFDLDTPADLAAWRAARS